MKRASWLLPVPLSPARSTVASLAATFTQRFGLPLTRVARVTEGAGVARREADGSILPLELAGYRHFESDT